MSTDDNDGMGLLRLAASRLAWIDRRQGVLAQNIANANTPGYVARDVQPFAQSMARALTPLAMTSPLHLAGTDAVPGGGGAARPAERSPDGNAVSVEEQLVKVADTDGAQALTTTLLHKYLSLYRTAIGK